MIYAFKTYRASEGNIEGLINRFREKTMPIFARLDIEVLNCWTSNDEPGTFFYLTRSQSDEAREAAWAAFGADTEWNEAKATSETDGLLLGSQSTLLFKPTDFSRVGAER